MKAIKIFLGIIFALILLIVVAVIALPLIIDPNDYRDEIAAQAEKATGRKVALNGDLKLSVFPWLGVEINDVEMGNAAGFEPKNMAEMQHAQVRIKLLPLLKKQVIVDRIGLNGAKIWVTQKADGANNWEDLAKAEEEPVVAEPEKDSPIASLSVAGLDLTDAQVIWRDDAANATYTLSQVNLSTGAVAEAEAFAVDFSGIAETSAPVQRLEFNGETRLTYELAGREAAHVRAKAFQLTVKASGAGLPEGETELQLIADIDADLATQALAVTNLMIELPEFKARGELTGTQIIDAPSFQGKIDVPEFNARAMLAKMLTDWEQPSDPKALTQVSLNSSFKATTDAAQLSALTIKLDSSKMTGKGSVQNFADPKIGFELNVDQLDVDRYLPPELADESEAEASEAPPYDRKQVDAIEIPVDVIKALNVSGKAKIGKLKAGGVEMQDVTLTLSVAGGKAEIAPLSAKMYGGTTTLAMTVDASGATPKFSLKPAVTDVQSGNLQQDMLEKIYLTGLANLSGGITAEGKTVGELRRTLNGNFAYAFRDGAVQGFDVVKKLLTGVQQLFPGKTGIAAKADAVESKFDRLVGSLTIVNGIATTKNFDTSRAYMKLSGSGTGNLIEEFISYDGALVLQPGFAESIKFKEAEKLEGLAIPVICRASANKSDCDIKLGTVLKAAVKAEAKERIDAVVDKQTDKLKEQAEEKLKDKAPELFELFRRNK